MRAVVLVGGEGTRLRPLTYTTPKQMLPIGDRPMIERVLGWLAGHGIDEAVLSLGYKPDAFIDAYPDGRCAGVSLRYAVEDSPLDTAGAIRFAALEGGVGEMFVVVNGDVVTDLDVTSLVEFHRSRGAEATIALTPVEDPSRFGVVVTDGDGRVESFLEKPLPGSAPTNLINAGTYVLEPAVLDRIPPGRCSIERNTFPDLVADRRLYAMASPAAWLDAGTPATYLEANLRWAGPETDSVIAAGATVAADATVRSSVLMAGAEVRSGATVTGSIIGPGAIIGAGASVTDLSVVGDGEKIPDGAQLSGARVPPPA